tara:strand:- start:800 stop:1045 length:246 start_codon:yes stop_codon:yes gene_type:complete
MISGWYESEYGAEDILIDEPMENVGDLAVALYIRYGEDVHGVDMELEGEYTNGASVSDNASMAALLDELHFLCAVLDPNHV